MWGDVVRVLLCCVCCALHIVLVAVDTLAPVEKEQGWPPAPEALSALIQMI